VLDLHIIWLPVSHEFSGTGTTSGAVSADFESGLILYIKKVSVLIWYGNGKFNENNLLELNLKWKVKILRFLEIFFLGVQVLIQENVLNNIQLMQIHACLI
jgi:hypothetical protein